MPAKRVQLSIGQPIEIGNVDVEFVIRDGTALMGRLAISKGGIDWKPPNAQKPHTATWKQLADWMSS